MGNGSKKEKFNREKCRQGIAKRYNGEINELKDVIRRLETENTDAKKIIDEQKKKLNEQEEKLNLYRMVVGKPEEEIVQLLSESRTKADFLEALNIFGKVLSKY